MARGEPHGPHGYPDILSNGREIVHEEVGRAWTLPSRYYTDPAIHAELVEKCFGRSWQFLGGRDLAKLPGQIEPITLLEGCLDEPIVLTRDREDTVHCLSNVCTHRGNLVAEGSGTANSLRCRYHGRRFGLDGKLLSMPEFEGVEGFPCAKDDLPCVPAGQWNGFWFAGVNPSCPLDEYLADVQERVGWMPFEQFVPEPDRARTYLVRANWALYVDNYLEGFHIPYIHAALNATLDYSSYRTVLLRYGNLQIGTAAESEPAFTLPSGHPEESERIGAFYFWMFPNLMLNFYPWGLSVNVVRPISECLTKVDFVPFVWRPELRDHGAGAQLDRVEREDEAVVEMVQRGLRSRFYDRGRYAVEREKGVHQFHRMLASCLD